ncbi:NlpC/P60 family protein [Rhizobium sp. HT1-10]|uniref:NlpC/P60 family protein n=1 Tax=Rhizobium sp. HT1-10 TaxID=3111638 RepID=UPI003C265C71
MTDCNTGRVLEIAASWIGTPYRHQGSTKAVGCDCLGLISGVWRELYGQDPELPPAYARDWAERSGDDRLMKAALRHFGPSHGLEHAAPGDLILFRWRPEYAAKHAAILDHGGHFIHAYEHAAVLRSPLVASWRRRVAGAFAFPCHGR